MREKGTLEGRDLFKSGKLNSEIIEKMSKQRELKEELRNIKKLSLSKTF